MIVELIASLKVSKSTVQLHNNQKNFCDQMKIKLLTKAKRNTLNELVLQLDQT